MNRNENISVATLRTNESGRINVSFPYRHAYVQKIKTIRGHRWHPVGKYWSFPDTDGVLGKILKIFERRLL